jgi:hypothetical protein
VTGSVPRLRVALRDATRALGIAHAAAPGPTLVWGGLLAIQGLLPAASVLLVKEVVDRLVDATGTRDVTPVVVAGMALALVMAAGYAADVLGRGVKVILSERVADHGRAVGQS